MIRTGFAVAVWLWVGTFSSGSIAQQKNQTQTSNNPPPIENPYLCPQHWEVDRILDFVQSSEEKPRTIRRRVQFVRAVEDAADRLLADDSLKSSWHRIARLTKARTLHYHACWGDAESDSRLKSSVEELAKLTGKVYESEYEFYMLERELVEFGKNEKSPDHRQALALLDKAFDYCEDQILVDRHLRLASNVIRVVNLMDADVEEEKKELLSKREEQFSRFGELFAESSDLRMSRYGKNLAKPVEAGGQLVGTQIELFGKCFDDETIDIKDFRGKVVLVDFWATWCGPCVREIPELVKLYDELESKNPGGFEVIGVNLDQDLDDLKSFKEENQLFWPNIVSEDARQLADKFGVRGIPTMMLVDQSGKIVAVKNRIDDLSDLARELLAKKPSSPEK